MASSRSWLELTDDQCWMLVEAFEETPLAVVLGGLTPVEDAHVWNRKHRYVDRAVQVSLQLVDAGLITVWEDPADGIGEGGLLLLEDARIVLAEPRNWWTYDPDDEDDPTVTEAQRAESAAWLPRWHYDLMPAPAAGDLGDLDNDPRVPSLVIPRVRSAFGPAGR